MTTLFYILSIVLIVVNLLPMVRYQHWMFRVWDFGRIQLIVLEAVVAAFGWVFVAEYTTFFWVIQILLVAVIAQNIILLIPYTPVYRIKKRNPSGKATQKISALSVNVYQFNTEYGRLIKLIRKKHPDLILTVETNSDWENALSVLESEYPYQQKHSLENTYGMHFYSKLEILSARTHFFVADDIPSFEINLQTKEGVIFTFFGVHPPPPSPSEEDTSKERDGDLLSVAKRVKDISQPVIVMGDFNNVAWARSSNLFRRISGLIDPRRGYGLVSTFHADYRLLRVPIDLLFHSSEIFIEDFKTLGHIGSDHFPMYCSFYIDQNDPSQESEVEEREAEDKEKAEEMIEEGKKENGERDRVVSK